MFPVRLSGTEQVLWYGDVVFVLIKTVLLVAISIIFCQQRRVYRCSAACGCGMSPPLRDSFIVQCWVGGDIGGHRHRSRRKNCLLTSSLHFDAAGVPTMNGIRRLPRGGDRAYAATTVKPPPRTPALNTVRLLPLFVVDAPRVTASRSPGKKSTAILAMAWRLPAPLYTAHSSSRPCSAIPDV